MRSRLRRLPLGFIVGTVDKHELAAQLLHTDEGASRVVIRGRLAIFLDHKVKKE